MTNTHLPELKSIVLFDGVCNLCNGFVQFIIRRDEQSKFQFASLQSNAAASILSKHNFPSQDFTSIILIKNGKMFLKSDAVLEIAKDLKGWRWSYFFRFIPPFIRNVVYDFIAKYRYRIFGRRDSCMVPTTDMKNRFLE